MDTRGRSTAYSLIGVLVLLLAIAACEVTALECYACTAVGCEDEFDPSAFGVIKVECRGSCAKSKVGDVVQRSCLPIKANDECKEVETDGEDASACTCNTNLCNDAASVTVSITTIVTVTGALVAWNIFKKL